MTGYFLGQTFSFEALCAMETLTEEDSITALLYEEKQTEQKISRFPKSLVITIISSDSFSDLQGKDLSILGGLVDVL